LLNFDCIYKLSTLSKNNKTSSHCQIITKEQMYGRNVPVGINHIQPIEFRVLVFDSILFKCFLHIKWSS